MSFRAFSVIVRASVLAIAAAGTASADVSKVLFNITADTGGSAASWSVEFPFGDDPGDYTWELQEPVDLMDNLGNKVATLEPGGTGIQIVSDPQIILGFNVLAGNATTNFTITSALLSFTGIDGAVGRASTQLNVNDAANFDGATLTGLHPGGKVFRTQYNGLVPAGSDFVSLVSGLSADPFLTNDISEEFPVGGGFAPIAGTVVSMSSEFHFSLSAGDIATGTSTFEIIPEPSSVLMLGAMVAFLARRRMA